MKLRASIIILNYNGRKYLESCVESVLASDYKHYEIIVVDNASTDDSIDHFENVFLNGNSDRIRIIKNPENWLSTRGLNQGIRAASGNVIVLLDNDTKVRPDWLGELLAPLMEDPTVGVTGSKLYLEDEIHLQHAGGRLRLNAIAAHDGYGEIDNGRYNEVREVEYVTGAATAIRRSCLDQMGGGLDEIYPIYFEDCDMCWQARRLGYKVLYVPSSVAIHLESATMHLNSPWYLFNYHRGRWRYMFKNVPVKQLLGRVLLEEWAWFWRYGRRNGHWRPLLKAYAALLPAIPRIINRRLSRRAYLKRYPSLNPLLQSQHER